eukprot:5378022-Pleurochrysis_carterae.AAC.3
MEGPRAKIIANALHKPGWRFIETHILHHSQRVPVPGTNAVKRCANVVTRKGGRKGYAGRRASGLLETYRFIINQRRLDLELAELTAAEAAAKLLLRWDGVDFSGTKFEPIPDNMALKSKLGAAQPVSSSTAAGSPSQHASAQAATAQDRPDGGQSVKQSSRGKPPEAASCAGSRHTLCMGPGIGSSTTPSAGSSKAVHSIGNASNELPINMDIPRAVAGTADGNADADANAGADADSDNAALARATPGPLSPGRYAATFNLECIRLRQKIDTKRNVINNFEAHIFHRNKMTVRTLRERDYVRQKAAAQKE